MKKCSKCGLFFSLADFHVNRATADGRTSACKGCQRALSLDYYYENREKVLSKHADRLAKLREMVPARFCRVCEEPTHHPKSPYCKKHSLEALDRRVMRRRRRNMSPSQLARARERERTRTRYRPEHNTKYGIVHQRTRAQVREVVEAGMAVCWRCRKPIRPDEPWDLGHVDGSDAEYAGPEHRACNRATARRDRRRAA